jgi:hypothetical protein
MDWCALQFCFVFLPEKSGKVFVLESESGKGWFSEMGKLVLNLNQNQIFFFWTEPDEVKSRRGWHDKWWAAAGPTHVLMGLYLLIPLKHRASYLFFFRVHDSLISQHLTCTSMPGYVQFHQGTFSARKAWSYGQPVTECVYRLMWKPVVRVWVVSFRDFRVGMHPPSLHVCA